MASLKILTLIFYSSVLLTAGSNGQSTLPKYHWPVYHQRYLRTGYCEYSFLLSVQNSDGLCLLPANVSTRLQEIERDRAIEKQTIKHLSSSHSHLSAQVHNLTLAVNDTSTEVTRLTTEYKGNYEGVARELVNVTHNAESTRAQMELLQHEQRSTSRQLQQTIEQQNQTIDELRTVVREQSRDLDEMKTLVEQHRDTINQYETRLARLESGTPTSGPTVAFSASRTTSLGPVIGHSRVTFDHVYVNIGNDYNPGDGMFTCETPGAYLFTYFMYKAIEVPQMAVYLMLNNTIQTAVFENNLKADEEWHYSADMSGNSLILDLDVGDTVSVVLRNGDYIHSNAHDKYCTFSGFLLK